MDKKQNADFRVSENNEILMILDEELLKPSNTYVFHLSQSSLICNELIEVHIDNPDLLKDFSTCKSFYVAQLTKAGFFQIIPNIKLNKQRYKQ